MRGIGQRIGANTVAHLEAVLAGGCAFTVGTDFAGSARDAAPSAIPPFRAQVRAVVAAGGEARLAGHQGTAVTSEILQHRLFGLRAGERHAPL